MSNKVRNVTKQLLGAEDVAFGRGIVQQNRGGTLVPVHKLDLDLPVADESELALTDTSKYPKASIGSRLFVAVNGQYQELSHIVPVIYRVGGALSAEYPYCENGNVIAKWTGEFPKTLTTADADFSPAGWQIYTVGSGRTIVSETQPPTSYGAQGLRWYNPTLPATFVYYDDGTSGQWVEESSQSTDGGIREDLKLLNSTVQIAGVPAQTLVSRIEALEQRASVGTLQSYTPVVLGNLTSGTGTYTSQVGNFYTLGDLVFFSASVTYTAHTGAGTIQISLPSQAAAFGGRVALSVDYNSFNVGTGRQCVAFVTSGSTAATIFGADPSGGAVSNVFDTAATITISGFYRSVL